MANWLLYGATGYTGKLIAAAAVARGHRPILAGRSESKLKPLAASLGLDYLAFGVGDTPAALHGLRRVDDLELVLHCAGPFIYTSAPMLAACLEVGAHYLDITGEIGVYEHSFAQDAKARQKGVVVMSGVGFDIVPSDCLNAYVAGQKPDAVQLDVAIESTGISGGESGANASAGTLKSMLEMIADGGRVRRGGQLVPHDLGAGARHFAFPHGARMSLPINWGDLSVAYRTTGIPNITTYLSLPPQQIEALHRFGYPIRSLLKFAPFRSWIANLIDANVIGPGEQARQTVRSHIYARATAADGTYAEAWLETIEPYSLTVVAALNAVERVLDGDYQGATTPALAFGADFVLDMPDTTRHDSLQKAP